MEPLFGEVANADIIREQWDQIVRVTASLRARVTPAHVVVERLHAGSPDRLAKAMHAMGHLQRTIHILRYIQEPPLRDNIQRQLNRGESRHELARTLFFSRQGQFCTADREEMMNKATCLSLLSNAVLVWNTVKLSAVIESLRTRGQAVPDEDIARISPLMHGHVLPNGTYHFARVRGPGAVISV